VNFVCGNGATTTCDSLGAPCCQKATCTDGFKNGVETDIDCGGNGPAPDHCPACSFLKMCAGSNANCVSNNCVANVCECYTDQAKAVPGTGAPYCVDHYEVTSSQYQTFWNAFVNPSTQPAECQWNASFTPAVNWPQQPGTDNDPVRGVNWCDAYAYCAWAGKRLCGAVGGGAIAQEADLTNVTTDEWFNICTGGNAGNNPYPYGATYRPSFCDGTDYWGSGDSASPTVVVETSLPLCQGGYPGVYNVSGDIAEWENACLPPLPGDAGAPDASTVDAGPAGDTCLARGGSYQSSSTDLRCDAVVNRPARSAADPSLGIRCCYN
jgi:formylglycine-generating enzyme required for sulfatase activity